eukprot:SAG31_NODE_897_length_11148_cov_15.102815_14_plen_172_part_00
MFNRKDAAELPEAILSYIAANPASTLATRFRLYVRHALVPSMQRVSELLHAHAAVVELPPTTWLVSKFPHEHWHLNTAEVFQHFWVSRNRLWVALLAEWDVGELGRAMPRGADWFPVGGLSAINLWSIARGSERQSELIGCVARTQHARTHDCCDDSVLTNLSGVGAPMAG